MNMYRRMSEICARWVLPALLAVTHAWAATEEPRPYVPEISEDILNEVRSLYPLAKRGGDPFDYSTPEQVDATYQAQQRIHEIGELADWALLRLYETKPDYEIGIPALRLHMRSNLDLRQSAYGLWLTRKVVRKAIADPDDEKLMRGIDEAMEYMSFWGNEVDLALIQELEGLRAQTGKRAGLRFTSPIGMLKKRITQGLPPGETDKSIGLRIPFHQRGLKAYALEPMKRLVAHREGLEYHPKESIKNGASVAPEITPQPEQRPSKQETKLKPTAEVQSIEHGWAVWVFIIIAALWIIWRFVRKTK